MVAPGNRKPYWKRWWFWVGVVLVLAVIGNLAPEGETPRTESPAPRQENQQETRQAPSEQPPEEPQRQPERQPGQSEADRWATKVQAELDVTTAEEFAGQMPDDIQPDIQRNGQDRVFVWTFKDGSQIEGVFRPKGGEGSEQGLVLYSVDIRD